MCLAQKREIKVSQNAKFSQNREINLLRKFHVIRYTKETRQMETKMVEAIV